MMSHVPMERLLEKTGSIYKLALLASMRALELDEGAPKLVEADSSKKVSTVALEEILAGKVGLKDKKKEKERKK